MMRWGQPQRIRVDNGTPWGTQSPLPSALALWLVGLGVKPVYGRPAQSTDNAIVERDHGVLAHWIEIEQCREFQDCQQRLNWAIQTQRERDRVPHGYTRSQAYPGLYTNPRAYNACSDRDLWHLKTVAVYLSRLNFRRKVELSGQVTLFANVYSVGKAYSRQWVTVSLDPQSLEWVFKDDYNHPLKRRPAKELTYEQISQLRLAKRRRN
jgi:transposase InsO family protein